MKKKREQKQVYTLSDLRTWREAAGDIDPPVRLGVFGDPVEHSLSPKMQNAALRECGIDLQYAAFHIRPDELGEALDLICSNNFVGANLTVPHKIAALQYLDDVDDTARKIGAVNTVAIREGKLVGFNTDGAGFARAIRSEFGVDLRDLRVLLLGAGGAGRAIAFQCAVENSERLVIVNRTLEKAKSLVQELSQYYAAPRVLGPVARLQALAWNDAALRFQIEHSDLIVNATPLGLKHGDPPVLSGALLAPHLMIYDTVYSASRTPLLIAAGESGARSADGLSMLLQQGAKSFEVWFEKSAPIDAMRAALSLT